MANRVYNLDFKMFMEGVETPFNNANIMCTPMGVEANINVQSNIEILSLKPKTAIQIFYKDWASKENPQPWRLMFDGFFSSFYKTDEAAGGRTIALQCRDFRMDIRRAPAFLAYEGDHELDTKTYYNYAGLFNTYMVIGDTPGNPDKSKVLRTGEVPLYDSTGLMPLSYVLNKIAGTVYNNQKETKQKDGDFAYANYGDALKSSPQGKSRCGFFLDALVRGLWTQAAGGTAPGVFLNKRIRLDKRFLIPKNNSGYDMWNRQTSGLNVGSFMMANSRFSSIEAAIMRVAGLFSVRPYSCSTPTFIPLGDDVSGKPNAALKYIIDESVRTFIVEQRTKEFGAQYTLNETMMLPSLEFTAPPNFNMFFPPMYDRVNFQYDFDSDFTRGHFTLTDWMGSAVSAGGLGVTTYQVPNALFNVNQNKKDPDRGNKPTLTLEERYKGVNVLYDSVSRELGCRDASKAVLDPGANAKADENVKKSAELGEEINKVKNKMDNTFPFADPGGTIMSGLQVNYEALQTSKASVDKLVSDKAISDKAKLDSKKILDQSNLAKALRRHALIKYMNSRFIGRVAVVDMMFNPYPMCGFPGVIVTDMDAYGKKSMKSILGTVQQVKHLIVITNDGAEASTSVVMNNARFEDEPTDMDIYGAPLYMKPTHKSLSAINKDWDYICEKSTTPTKYFVPEPKSGVREVAQSKSYDFGETTPDSEYMFAKDFISITKERYGDGERNTIYIDEEYETNRIAKFYRDVFQCENNPMVGENGQDLFMFDTVHEAIVELRTSKPELLVDYDAAINYVRRGVCSADQYFHGILGLSSMEENTVSPWYENRTDNFQNGRIDSEYFGVTSALWLRDDFKGLKPGDGGIMDTSGQFSSIRESIPITAFIKERKDAVKAYLKAMSERAQTSTK